MRCKRCNSLIREHEIDLDYVIECWKCGAIYELEEAERQRLENAESLPKGFDILELRSEMNISWKWRGKRNRFIEFFALVWNSFVLFFLMIMILSGQLMAILFLSLHIAAGVLMAYYVLGRWFNKTHLVVSENRISTKHKPFPWFFYRSVDRPSEDLDQLYCKRYVYATVNNVPQYAYKVVAQLKDFSELDLIKGLNRRNQALFLEQKLEQYLGIQNRPMDGGL